MANEYAKRCAALKRQRVAQEAAGNIGPQTLVPEEILTVPAAYGTGTAMGSTAINVEVRERADGNIGPYKISGSCSRSVRRGGYYPPVFAGNVSVDRGRTMCAPTERRRQGRGTV